MNQISKFAVVERATEIVNGESNNQDKAKDNRESQNQEPNTYVSEFCQICLGFPEDETSPIWTKILFEGRAVNFKVKLTACGDGVELMEVARCNKKLLL